LIVFYDRRHLFHLPMKELDNGNWIENPDRPERIESIRSALESAGFQIKEPRDYHCSHLFQVHTPEYVEWLKAKSNSVSRDREYFPEVFGYDKLFDTGTPVTSGCYVSALASVSTALNAVDSILESEPVSYALCRPPGHHAGKSTGGGYCYFNNAAIAAKYYQKHTRGYVAILDLDFHHGNGTQEIFYYDDTVFYVSIHGDPKNFYPWISGNSWEIGSDSGEGFNMNFPLAGGIEGPEYMRTLSKALQEIEDFSPDLMIISLGTDGHKDDDIGHFNLSSEDYSMMGKLIGEIEVQKLIVQEGGYNPKANSASVLNFLTSIR